MLGLDLVAVPRVDDRHSGRTAQNLGEHAFAVRRQVSEDYKRQPVGGRDGFEELLERLDTARRGTDADDGEAGHHVFSPSEAIQILLYSLSSPPQTNVGRHCSPVTQVTCGRAASASSEEQGGSARGLSLSSER